MTWIVGAAAALGYAVGISDIRVTFSDGSERDCLQKIYPMARFIAAGFAGSVRIGFEMLKGLAFQLQDAPENMAFFPQEVADCLTPLARDIFQSFPPEERALHSHLMLLGAHPTDNVGIPGLARCSVHILRSPEFEPAIMRIGEVVSIGSGSGVPPYQDVLANLSADPMSLLHGETEQPNTKYGDPENDCEKPCSRNQSACSYLLGLPRRCGRAYERREHISADRRDD